MGALTRLTGWILLLVGLASECSANILWMGGEDIDFPNGAAVCTMSNGARSGYGRTSIDTCTYPLIAISSVFPGGAITSGWLSFRQYFATGTSSRYLGFVTVGTQNSLWVGTDSSDATKVALWKYDGTTWTELASSATGVINGPNLFKVDMQMTNYGSSGTVNIYINAAANPALTYTGNIAVGSNTSFNGVAMAGVYGSWSAGVSEIIVSDSDSRLMSLVTLAPTSAGTTNQWTGSYTTVNPTTINDTSYITDNTAGDTFQAKVGSLPSGSWNLLGAKIAARAAKTTTGIGSLSIGVYTNGSAYTPSAVTLSSGWANFETYLMTNPVTSTNWQSSDIGTFQFNLQSGP